MVTSFCSPFLSVVSHVWFVQCTLDAESSFALVLSILPFLSGWDSVGVVLRLVVAVRWQWGKKLLILNIQCNVCSLHNVGEERVVFCVTSLCLAVSDIYSFFIVMVHGDFVVSRSSSLPKRENLVLRVVFRIRSDQ